MANLANYLFGNVDEEGHLDNVGLDEELRESLQKVAEEAETKLFSRIFLAESLGLVEKDEEESERVETPRTPVESIVKPAEDAIDYSDFDTLFPAFRSDEVLNFTELFATKITRKKLQQKNKNGKSLNIMVTQPILDTDDRVMFQNGVPRIQKEVSALTEISNTTDNTIVPPTYDISNKVNPLSLKDENRKPEKEIIWKIPEKSKTYLPVMTVSWEDYIIWEHKPSQSWPNSSLVQKSLSASDLTYRQLEEDDWLDSVLCDEPKIECPFTKLIYDLNDPNMLFEVSAGEDLPKPSISDQMVKKRGRRQTRLITKHPSLASDIEILTRDEESDPFNISNDQLYDTSTEMRQQRVRQTIGQLVVQHSLPALKLKSPFFKTKLSKSELRAFHRPAIQFQVDRLITFARTKPKSKKQKEKSTIDIRSSRDLTLRDTGTFVLLEYSEEYPPIISNVGMGSLLLNYYRKIDENDSTVPKLDIGDAVVLDVSDASPFMNFGDVEPGQIITALYNNLVRAPVFKHNQKDTDFLVIRNTYKGKSKYYVREIKNLFVVGQTYPMQEVPGPHSRKITNTVKNRLQVSAFRLIKSSIDQTFKLRQLSKLFPEYTEIQIRQRVKEFAELERRDDNGGVWRLKRSLRLPTEEELRKMLSPEMICLYESMLVGQRHLLDSGYVKTATGEEEGNDESKLSIEEQLAPWITTRNFINATQGKAMLKLHGEGDPTGSDEGFSFIRVSMKDIFLKAGESVEEKLAEIEKLPKNAHKYSVAEQQQKYREEIDRIWNAQYASLSNTNEIASDSEQKYSRYRSKRQRSLETDSNQLNDPELRERDYYRESRSPSVASIGDFNDSISVDGSMGSRASYAYGSHRNRKLIIRRLMKSSDGEELWHVEEVTDPAVINAYIRHRQMIEEQATSAEFLEPTDDEEKNKRLRKRIQDQLAKLKRNLERRMQRAAARQTVSGETSAVPQKEKKTEQVRRCGNCGELGHMKTNRKCPMYVHLTKASGHM